MTENLIPEDEDDKFNEGNQHQDSKPQGDDSKGINLNSRQSKDSVQIHSNIDLVDLEEVEEDEKCYSMKEGSILGGVFALSSLALGTGAFSIPIKCTQIGCYRRAILSSLRSSTPASQT